MELSFDSIYKSEGQAVSKDVFILKKYRTGIFKVVYLSHKRNKGFVCPDRKRTHEFVYYQSEDEKYIPSVISFEKLEESISRSKRLVWEYALCNDWDYFFTGTIDKDKLDRYDFDCFSSKLRKFIDNYNRLYPEGAVTYLLIPEQHEDGAWHVHGLLKGIKPEHLVFNKNSYFTWKQYDNAFGYMSIGRIRDKERVASYIMKYIGKSIGKTRIARGRRSFYHSMGLKKAEKIAEFSDVDGALIDSLDWDFEREDGYCKLKMIKDTVEIEQLILFLGGNPACIVGGALSQNDKKIFLNEGFAPIPEDLFYDSSTGD